MFSHLKNETQRWLLGLRSDMNLSALCLLSLHNPLRENICLETVTAAAAALRSGVCRRFPQLFSDYKNKRDQNVVCYCLICWCTFKESLTERLKWTLVSAGCAVWLWRSWWWWESWIKSWSLWSLLLKFRYVCRHNRADTLQPVTPKHPNTHSSLPEVEFIISTHGVVRFLMVKLVFGTFDQNS